MTGRKAWLFWMAVIAVFSLGITLVVQPREPSALFIGLCLTLDAIGVAIWWIRRPSVRSEAPL